MSSIRMELRQHADFFTIDSDDPGNPDNAKGFSFSKHVNADAQIFLNTPNEATESLVKEYCEKIAELTQSLSAELEMLEQGISHEKNNLQRKSLKVS